MQSTYVLCVLQLNVKQFSKPSVVLAQEVAQLLTRNAILLGGGLGTSFRCVLGWRLCWLRLKHGISNKNLLI